MEGYTAGEAMTPDAVVPTFYALQPRWLSADRLFKVFVSSQRLAFAYVAGQLYDQRSASVQLQQLNLVLFPLVRRWLRRRDEREQHYSFDNVFEPDFLRLDERNFYLERRDVSGFRINWRRSLWATVNAGSVTIMHRDTSDRRFILVGDQVPDDILTAVQRFWPDVEMKGTPRLPKVRAGAAVRPAV
jgi:hypothetical protein